MRLRRAGIEAQLEPLQRQAILCTVDGRLLEGLVTNVFIISGDICWHASSTC